MKSSDFAWRRSRRLCLALAFALPIAAPGWAQVVWTGGGTNSDFLNGTNWNTNQVPAIGSAVVIDGGGVANQPTLGGTTTPGSLSISAGTLTIGSGGNLETIFGGTVVSGTGSLVVQSGGTLTNDLEIVLGGGSAVLSGLVVGNVIVAGGRLNLAGGDITGQLRLAGGTVHATANTTITGEQAGQFDGLFSAAAGTTLALHNRIVAFEAGRFVSFGSATATGIIAIDPSENPGATPTSSRVNNAGTVNVEGGTLDLRADGTHSGTFQVAESAKLQFTGSTHIFEESATLGGTGEVLFSGSNISIQRNTPFTLSRTTRLAGGTLALQSGAVVGSTATFGVVDGVGGTITGTTGVFRNEGTFTVGVGSTPTVALTFQNTGTVEVKSGGVLTFTAGYTQTAGLLDLQGTTARIVSTGAPLSLQGGLLTGSGTITGNVAIGAATLRPIGTLTIDGGLTLGPGAIWEVAATQSAASRLNLTGSSSLNLNNRNLLIEYGGAGPNPGAELTILSSSQPIVGTFGNLNPTQRVIFDAGSFVVTSTGNQVTLSQFAPAVITELIAHYAWVGADGDWDARPNWDRASVPRPTTALIENGTTFISQTTNVGIANGGTARKSGGMIRTTSLTISDGRLVLTDGADIQNFESFDPDDGDPVRIDRPIFLGGTGTRGILQIGDGGAPGAGIIHPNTEIREAPVVGNPGGSVVFNHNASAYRFNPLIRHDISVLQEGPGTTSLNDANVYSGGTTVTGGRLSLTANSGLGHANGGLHLDGGGIRYAAAFSDLRAFTLGTNGGTLDTGGPAGAGLNVSFGHAIPSTGPFFKDGLGTLTLTAAQAVSSTWTVRAGTLALTGGGTHAGNFEILGNTVLQFGGGTHTLSAGATFGGAGELRLTGGTLGAAGAATISSPFVMSGGILNGPGTITLNSLMDWIAGQIAGFNNGAVDLVNARGGLRLSGGSMKTITARTLDHGDGINPVAGSWTGGTLFLQAGSIFNNRAQATFTTTVDDAVAESGGGVFNNAGTFTKSGGSGNTTINAAFNNSGTVNVNSGSLLLAGGGTHSGAFNLGAGARHAFFSGTHSLSAGSTISDTTTSVLEIASGTTTIAPALTLAGTLRISGGALALNNGATLNALQVVSGSLGGPGAFTVNGPLTWSGGVISGANPATEVLNVFGGATLDGTTKTLVARTFNHGNGLNPGTANWTGGSLLMQSGSVFNNRAQATFATSFDGVMTGFSGGGTFNNAGTFTKSGGAGTTRIESVFNNTGTVNVNSGTLQFLNGGTHAGALNLGAGARLDFGAGTFDVGAGTTLTAAASSILEVSSGSVTFAAALSTAGTFRVSGGTATFNGAANLHTLDFASGILNGPGTITAQGPMTWTAGIIGGTSANVLNAFGGLTMSGVTTKQLTTRTINHGDGVNPSAALWSDGWFFMQGGSTFNNRAHATFETTFDYEIASSSGSEFNNAGTFIKSAGTGTTNIQTTFNNTGTVNANSGTLRFSGTFTQTAGALLLNGGNVASAGGVLNIAGGTLGGAGTITGSVQLGPSAILAPGNSVGSLAITGNLSLSGTSRILMELAGLVQGVGYDHVNVGGTLVFGGALTVNLASGFVPATGSSFNLFDAAGFSGTFASIALPTLTPGLSWDTTNLGLNGLLTVTGTAIPEPSTYALLAGLGALVFAAWRRRTAVAAGRDR